MSQMLKSSGAMGLATFASRVLGMVREILYTQFMGAGVVAGAFTLAFMIPNLFRRLLGEGALTAAFIPIFKEKEITSGEKEMWRSANAAISGMIVAASVIVVLAVAGISVALIVDAPDPVPSSEAGAGVGSGNAEPFSGNLGWLSAETRLMLELLRVMFPYLLLVCFAAICIGILNARGSFFVPALGPTILNLVLIGSVLWLAPLMGARLEEQIFALAIGVLIAGAAQAGYLLPALYRQGYRPSWIAPWRNETIQAIVRKMIPGMMGVAAFQLNVLLTQSIAWSVDPTIVAAFGYAVRLMELPQGVFGISLATFLLPTLAALAAEKKYPDFRATLGQAIGYLAFSNSIASVLLVVLAEPIVRLLFERGEFGPWDTARTSFALACLAPGLIAFSLVNILARAFYALGDTQTPMKISAVCLGINVVLTLWLVRSFAEGGLGIANTTSAFLNVALLSYGLRRKLKFLNLAHLRWPLASMAGGAILAAESAWLVRRWWEQTVGHPGLLEKFGEVFIPIGVACLVYGLVLLWMKVPQAWEFLELLQKKLFASRRSNHPNP